MSLCPTSVMTQSTLPTSQLGVVPLPGPSSDMTSYHMASNPTIDGEGLNDRGGAISDTGIWNMGYDITWPSWSVGSDFNLQAVNASIAATIMQPGQLFQPTFEQFECPDEETVGLQANNQTRTLEAICRSWTSYVDPSLKSHAAHGTVTPVNECEFNERADVDEVYRTSLTRRLQPRPYDNSLPSTDFLNLCVQLYFAKFHAIFPIIHAPTFRPSMANSLLLISVCSIGSLFIGSTSATAQGVKIFETLNKCILNSWERYLSRSSSESLSMIQAAIIGQTFGLLSGSPNHPNLVDSFNGTIIAWARQRKMFKEKQAKPLERTLHCDGDALDKAWRSWIESEQTIRVVLALHLHDAELSLMFHHEPLLRHEPKRIPVAASERLFSASNSTQWAALSLQDSQKHFHHPTSSISGIAFAEPLLRIPFVTGMTQYALLEGIGAAICEKRQQGQLDEVLQVVFVNDLIAWSTRMSLISRDNSADPFCLMILWHSLFISLFGDSDMLERAIGRDGSTPAKDLKGYLHDWASSASAKRCVIHASLLSNRLDAVHIGSEPAIHVPQCLFRAAIASYLYAHFGPSEESHASMESADFPEMQHLGITPSQHLFKTSGNRPGKPTIAELRRLWAMRDMLQRVGHWGIARRYSALLAILFEGDVMNNPSLGS